MQLTKLVITMNAAMAGCNQVINRCPFVDGVFTYVGSLQDVTGFSRYFNASFNCTIWTGPPNESPVVEVEEVVEEVTEEVTEEMTDRQQKILDAISCTDVEEWLDDVVCHPHVNVIAELMEDATVTKEEIIDVVENWMDDEEDAEQDAPADPDEDQKD